MATKKKTKKAASPEVTAVSFSSCGWLMLCE
jgi:hypothetical protein